MRWEGVAQIHRELLDTGGSSGGVDQERVLGADAWALRGGEGSTRIAVLASRRNETRAVRYERHERRSPRPPGEFARRAPTQLSPTASPPAGSR